MYFLNTTTKDVFGKDGGSWSFLLTLGSGSAPPPPAPPPGDILDGSGNVSAAAYAAMAYDYDAYQTYRNGPPASLSGVQTLNERADAGNINHGGGNNMPFQFGPENNSDPNLYMSIHAVSVGKPLTGSSITDGVVWCQNFAIDRETAQQRPHRLWQDNELLPPAFRSGGAYRTGTPVIQLNDAAYLPVCEYRGENAPDSPNTRLSLICTIGSATVPANMMTAGTYTAKNAASCSFPLGFRPTAISVTGGGEFALVSGWNVPETKGQVALVSLGSAPEGVSYTATGPTERYDWWHGWRDFCHPGFCDQGNFVFMKVIDMIDLPTNCKAPTSITATTGLHPYTTMLKYGPNGIDNFQQLDSPMASNRALMLPGGEDYERYAKGGVAVVTSQSEKTVVFIDLGPVFAYTNDMYLGSAAKNLETQTLGFGPTQWPYTLSDKPAARAVIAKTITLAESPTAVLSTPNYQWWSKDDQKRQAPPNDMYWEPDPHYPRSWVATRDGKLYIFSLGRYAAGVKPTTPAPADIAQVGLVTGLGTNVIYLAASKSLPSVGDDLNDSVVYLDRAARKVGYVAFSTTADGTSTTGTAGTLVQDSRMDPVACCTVDPYHTESNIVTVADWTGNCLHNYRYGEIHYGGDTVWEPAPLNTPSATPPGEYCGALTLTFRPLNVHCSNTP